MQPCAPAPVAPIDGQHVELADIKSQYLAKRALEIAAGGGHNLFGVGLPRRPGLGYALLRPFFSLVGGGRSGRSPQASKFQPLKFMWLRADESSG
jgi:hypothetical protein